MLPNSKGYQLLVDYPISAKPDKKSRTITIYPDILVLKDKLIVGIVDVKIDLGYARVDFMERYTEKIELLQNVNSVSFYMNVGKPNKSKVEFNTRDQLDYAAVIISGENSHGRIDKVKSHTDCFVLMAGAHPNNSNVSSNEVDKFIEKIAEDETGWKNLNDYIEAHYR